MDVNPRLSHGNLINKKPLIKFEQRKRQGKVSAQNRFWYKNKQKQCSRLSYKAIIIEEVRDL